MISKDILKTFKNNILVSTISIVAVSIGLYYIIHDDYPSTQIETFDDGITTTEQKEEDDSLNEYNQTVQTISDENNFIKKQISGGFFDNKMGASTILSDGGGSNLTYVPFMQALSLPSSFVDSLEKNKNKTIDEDNTKAYYHEEKAGRNMQDAEDLFNQINSDRASKYTTMKNIEAPFA
jgi:Zn/Cd-binding protein ZinT